MYRVVSMTSRAVQRAAVTIGEHLTDWRKIRGLTMEQVSERAGITRPTLHKIEHGSAKVSLETTLEIFRALGILDTVIKAADPLNSDIGRLRAAEQLPKRVRASRKSDPR
jgi:transcriptional regulator with XRE-family HTH domain